MYHIWLYTTVNVDPSGDTVPAAAGPAPPLPTFSAHGSLEVAGTRARLASPPNQGSPSGMFLSLLILLKSVMFDYNSQGTSKLTDSQLPRPRRVPCLRLPCQPSTLLNFRVPGQAQPLPRLFPAPLNHRNLGGMYPCLAIPLRLPSWPPTTLLCPSHPNARQILI